MIKSKMHQWPLIINIVASFGTRVAALGAPGTRLERLPSKETA